MKKRIIGLDYGSKTVGVAVSDPLGFTAQGLETITRKDENKLRKTYARIEALIREYEAEQIVLGYPKNMNDTEGERVEKTLAFKEALERRTGLEVILWDERMSTVASERVLMEGNVRREDRKTYIDKMAAAFILQGYLDYQSFSENQAESEDSEEDEADAYILKETGAETEEAYYEFVEDSTELEVISKVFEQMLDDIDLKYE